MVAVFSIVSAPNGTVYHIGIVLLTSFSILQSPHYRSLCSPHTELSLFGLPLLCLAWPSFVFCSDIKRRKLPVFGVVLVASSLLFFWPFALTSVQLWLCVYFLFGTQWPNLWHLGAVTQTLNFRPSLHGWLLQSHTFVFKWPADMLWTFIGADVFLFPSNHTQLTIQGRRGYMFRLGKAIMRPLTRTLTL